MPFSLSEYKASLENSLDLNVIDEFRRSNWLLDNIPFDDGANVTGADTWDYGYDRVTTLATATTRAVNVDYTAQEAKTTKQTVSCKIFGGSFQVDRTQINTARYGSRLAFQLGQKIQATRALFNDLFINGDEGVTATEFDGLAQALAGSTTESSATADLSTSALIDSNYKAFIDELYNFFALLDGTPDALLMNRTMHSRLRSIALRAGYLTQSEDAFGRKVTEFDGIPFVDLGDQPGSSNPVIGTSAPGAGVTGDTAIYAVRLALNGLHAVAPDGSPLINTYLPNLSLPGAVKTGEVEMVSTLALKATRAAGVLKSIPVLPGT